MECEGWCNMKMKQLFWFLGLWTIPLGLLAGWVITADVTIDKPIKTIIITIVALILPIIITSCNYRRLKLGYTDFSFKDALGLIATDEEYTKEFIRATYPEVKKELLSDKPKDLVLGTYKGKYVSAKINKDGLNAFVVAVPGGGKSVLLIGWLMSMLYQDRIYGGNMNNAGERFNFFVVDIKLEMMKKLIKINGKYKASGNDLIQVVQPSNRDSYGWDALYHIRGANVSETVKLKAVTDIAEALVEESGDNPYFYVNARKIMTGVFLWFIDKGLDFIDIIHQITRRNLGELLQEIVEGAEIENNGIVLDKLKSFVGKTDNESIQDIESTLKTSLDCFSYPDIEYMLGYNPNRTSPQALNDGVTNIDLAIEDGMLSSYKTVFRLITIQILKHVESDFMENSKRRTLIAIDEAFKVGKITGLSQCMAVARSKSTSIILIMQDKSQMMDLYGEYQAESILNICQLKLFLSGSGDIKTYIEKMVGEYRTESHSYDKGVLTKNNIKYSDNLRPIITGHSLMELMDKQELIAIYFGKYFRIKKLRYFEDKYLKPIYDEISEYNKLHAQD